MASLVKEAQRNGHNNNNYLDEDMPIMCFDPAKSPFLVMILFKFAQKPVGNLIFRITSLTTFFVAP